MPASAIDVVQPAVQHARRELLQPFRFGVWARYAFLGILTGELSSAGCNLGGNFNTPSQQHPQELLPHWPPHVAQHPVALALLVASVLAVSILLLYASSVLR